MTVNIIPVPGHSPIPAKVRQIVLIVLLITCATGIANVWGRFDQLCQLVTTYYHPYLAQAGLSEFQLAEIQNLPPQAVQSIDWDERSLSSLQKGEVIQQPGNYEFSLLVPLMLYRGEELKLIGVLALGPRQDGRQYSLDEVWTFKTLASRAGTAIYIAQLNMESNLKLKQQISALEERIKSLESRLN